MVLENINSPEDVKKLSLEELNLLGGEMREALLHRLSNHGGHFGPNFGMVEATIALHYVFNSPEDKIVFDVSHQSYPHKMLTGRKEAYLDPEKYDDVSGYSEPSESAHDHFVIGHTSTSVSLAGGLAKGRDLKGEKGNVIAVIGDGSLSGGEAFEGLDYAGELDTNFIIVVNDNQMSIAENHGGLYRNLQELRESQGTCPCNFFKAMGLDYLYVDQGNDIRSLISAFQKVKDIGPPRRGTHQHPERQGIPPGRRTQGAMALLRSVRHRDRRTQTQVLRRRRLRHANCRLPVGEDERRPPRGRHHGRNTHHHGIHQRQTVGSRTAVRGRGYRRGARRRFGFRHR